MSRLTEKKPDLIGDQGLDKSNESGDRLVEFCQQYEYASGKYNTIKLHPQTL